MVTINGYPNYKIDRKGNIYNKKNQKMRFYVSHNGYLNATLYRDGVNKKFRVHRLVAEHFLNPDESRRFVNHKDGNKLNNSVENLEWCTSRENTEHAIKTGLIKPKKGKAHKLSKRIIATDENGDTTYYYGTRDVERKTGVDRKYVCRVLNGKRKHHKGVVYKYD